MLGLHLDESVVQVGVNLELIFFPLLIWVSHIDWLLVEPRVPELLHFLDDDLEECVEPIGHVECVDDDSEYEDR